MVDIIITKDGTALSYDSTVSDSEKYEKIKFNLPESWEGYTKTAVFRHGETVVNVILNGDSDLCTGEDECYIPHEVIKAPEFTVSVFGVSGDSRATSTQARIRVKQSGYAEGDEPSDPTPTAYEQLITLVKETNQIAQSVRTDADNGVFKGEKGDKGDPAVTDQSYDPNSENAQSGTAVAEAIAQSKGKYELIEEITTTEEISEFVRTQEPDGTEYNFSEILLAITGISGTVNQFWGYVDNTSNAVAQLYRSGTVQSNAVMHVHYLPRKTFLGEINASVKKENGAIENSIKSFLISNHQIDKSNYKKIFLRCVLPAGSTIKIYGIRGV